MFKIRENFVHGEPILTSEFLQAQWRAEQVRVSYPVAARAPARPSHGAGSITSNGGARLLPSPKSSSSAPRKRGPGRATTGCRRSLPGTRSRTRNGCSPPSVAFKEQTRPRVTCFFFMTKRSRHHMVLNGWLAGNPLTTAPRISGGAFAVLHKVDLHV